MEPKKERLAYIQWLRVFAAAAVIIAHTDGQTWKQIPWDSRDWMVLSMYDGLVRWPVLMFMMITGTIFLSRRTSLRSILTKNIPRVLTAFGFWSAVYTFFAWRSGTKEGLLMMFLSGHYHMWYLPYLCGVYLMIPFLQKIAEDEKLTQNLLVLSCILGLLIPWGADALSLIWPATAGVVTTVASKFSVTFFAGLLALLPMGYLLHKTEISPERRKVIYVLGILGAVLTGVGTIWSTGKMGTYSSVFCTNASPTVIAPGVAIYVFAKYNLNRLPKAVAWVADHSFGIYLVHALVIEQLQVHGFHVLTVDPILGVPMVSVVAFAISLAISVLLSKLPVVGRYLV